MFDRDELIKELRQRHEEHVKANIANTDQRTFHEFLADFVIEKSEQAVREAHQERTWEEDEREQDGL